MKKNKKNTFFASILFFISVLLTLSCAFYETNSPQIKKGTHDADAEFSGSGETGLKIKINADSPFLQSSPDKSIIQTEEYTVTSLDAVVRNVQTQSIVKTCRWIPSSGTVSYNANVNQTGLFSLEVIQTALSGGKYVTVFNEKQINLSPAYVTTVNGNSAAVIYDRLKDYIYHENDMWLKYNFPRELVIAEALYKTGIINDLKTAEFELIDENNAVVKIFFAPDNNAPLVNAVYSSMQGIPRYQKNTDKNYRYECFKDKDNKNVIYLGYNSCRDMTDQTFSDFTDQMFAFIDQKYSENDPVDKFILDIRNNTGGLSSLSNPLIDRLRDARYSYFNRSGKLFVLIGRKTFSAGVFLCDDLSVWTNALFIGEPTGGKPTDMYSHNYTYYMPNSGIKFDCSNKYVFNFTPYTAANYFNVPNTPSFMPDINIDITKEDYFNLIDPLTDYILNNY